MSALRLPTKCLICTKRQDYSHSKFKCELGIYDDHRERDTIEHNIAKVNKCEESDKQFKEK